MKPYQICQKAGLKNLNELIKITGVARTTLISWSKNKPKLFQCVVYGAVVIKNERERE